MTKEARLATGLKPSEVRHANKIVPHDLKTIMLGVAEAILAPNSFTNDAMSLDIDGKPIDVFSPEAVQLDLLGWIIKLSYQHWPTLRSGRRTIGHLVSVYIDSHIRTVSADKLRLMTVGDAGPELSSKYLIHAANRLHTTTLPVLFAYAKDYESEEDKKKREEKAAARKAKKLATQTDLKEE